MNKSKRISMGAMITILSIVLMVMSSVIPKTTLFFMALTSFLTSILVIEVGVSTAIVSFIATIILGSIFVPNKILVVPYALFFGYYGIIKFYIEGIGNVVLEWIIKVIIFNIIMVMKYFVLTKFVIDQVNLPFHMGFIALGLLIIFIVYDYVFSMFIQYYNTKISKHIR